MKWTVIIAVLFIIFLNYQESSAQYRNEPQISLFQKSYADPIKIVVENNQEGRIKFIAENSTFYPFLVSVRFSNIQNLTPQLYAEKKYVVKNGIKVLETLTKVNTNASHNYRYEFSYSVGDYRLHPDMEYPYLFPIKNSNKVVVPAFTANAETPANIFLTETNDTIYAMRKGIITAKPNVNLQEYRISDENSIEIYHQDGTVMVYRHINPENIFVQLGQQVYPGQPIGTASSFLHISLYSIQKGNKLKYIPINYYLEDNTTQKYSESIGNKVVSHSDEIVKKEMTKKEIKKFSKNKLFE